MARLLASLHIALLASGLGAAFAAAALEAVGAVEAAARPEDARRWSWDASYKADLLHSAATGTV